MAEHQRQKYEPITCSSSYDETEGGHKELEKDSGSGSGGGFFYHEGRRVNATSMLVLLFVFLCILAFAQNHPAPAPPLPRVAAQGTVAHNVSTMKEKGPHPVLSDVVVGENIEGDVSWLLNFAVLGFPKCGTSFLMNYLRNLTGVYMDQKEWCNLHKDRPHKLVERFYHNAGVEDMTPNVKRGLKCPKSLQSEYALGNLATYFDRTDFIVQVRHPILWFQSFYNYRSYERWPQQMLPPHQLIGPCDASGPYISLEPVVGKWHVCTDRANFHHSLARLGKTPMSTLEEMKLLWDNNMSIVPVKGKVFLLEVGQLNEENPMLGDHFRETLRGFLGLHGDILPPFMDHHANERNRSKMDPENLVRTIDICDEEHAAVRSILLESGRASSKWIREYFLKSPDVVVSSQEHFLELLQSWEKDPCDEKTG